MSSFCDESISLPRVSSTQFKFNQELLALHSGQGSAEKCNMEVHRFAIPPFAVTTTLFHVGRAKGVRHQHWPPSASLVLYQADAGSGFSELFSAKRARSKAAPFVGRLIALEFPEGSEQQLGFSSMLKFAQWKVPLVGLET